MTAASTVSQFVDGCSAQLRDDLRIAQSNRRPGLAAVGGLVGAVAHHDVAADVGLRRRRCRRRRDSTGRCRRSRSTTSVILPSVIGVPRGAAVGRLPRSAAGGAKPIFIRPRSRCRLRRSIGRRARGPTFRQSHAARRAPDQWCWPSLRHDSRFQLWCDRQRSGGEDNSGDSGSDHGHSALRKKVVTHSKPQELPISVWVGSNTATGSRKRLPLARQHDEACRVQTTIRRRQAGAQAAMVECRAGRSGDRSLIRAIVDRQKTTVTNRPALSIRNASCSEACAPPEAVAAHAQTSATRAGDNILANAPRHGTDRTVINEIVITDDREFLDGFCHAADARQSGCGSGGDLSVFGVQPQHGRTSDERDKDNNLGSLFECGRETRSLREQPGPGEQDDKNRDAVKPVFDRHRRDAGRRCQIGADHQNPGWLTCEQTQWRDVAHRIGDQQRD